MALSPAASSLHSTASCSAEPQLLSHFAEAASSCGSIEIFIIGGQPTRRLRPRLKIRCLKAPAEDVPALPGLIEPQTTTHTRTSFHLASDATKRSTWVASSGSEPELLTISVARCFFSASGS